MEAPSSPSTKGAGGSGGSEFAAMLRETRERAARINRYVDMIPARYYLGTECKQVKESRSIRDPAKMKTTCQLIAEAALADAAANKASDGDGSGGGAGSSSGNAHRRKKERKREGETSNGGESGGLADLSAGPEEDGDLASSRGELHAKLERRIMELREERIRKQSEKDKAKATKARKTAATPEKPAKSAAGAGSSKRPALSEDAELNFTFQPKQASLPFEAGIGRRGQKVQRLRADLRRTEAEAAKLRKAEEAGDGKEVRKELAMRKALQRAKGEKVHDDSQKLRKAQKKLELRKKKGKDTWKDRVTDDKKQKEEKAEKRKENLAERRGKKKGKKGRSGFEGARNGYLNS